MKKFKTKKQINYLKIIIFLIILAIFTLLSFLKLNKSYSKIIKAITYNFSTNEKNNYFSFSHNLDYLINTYSFKEQNKSDLYKKKKIHLYSANVLEKYNDGTTISDVIEILKNNLSKLGIETIIEKRSKLEPLTVNYSDYEISSNILKDITKSDDDINYYVDINFDSIKNTIITINGKKYAKILFALETNNKNYQENQKMINKMNEYLNNHYPGISRGIYEKEVSEIHKNNSDNNVIFLKIGGLENNFEEINNSTEILSLMFYNTFGD